MRLCEYVERIGPLTAENAWDAIVRHVAAWVATYPADTPVQARGEPYIDSLNPLLLAAEVRRELYYAPPAMAGLLNTARKLKAMMRCAKRAWGSLHGEASLEDIILVASLRETCPAAFAYLVRHYAELRQLAGSHGAAELRELLQKLWKEEVGEGRETGCAFVIVANLFPALRGSFSFGDTRQRVRVHDRYWNRVIGERIGQSEARDQEVLRHIDECKSGNQKALLTGLSDSEDYGVAFELLVSRKFGGTDVLCFKELCSIEDALIDSFVAQQGPSGDIERFAGVWRVYACMACCEEDGQVPWLVSVFDRHLAQSVNLCTHLALSCVTRHSRVFSGGHEIHCRLLDVARRVFKDGQALLAAVDPGEPWSVVWMVDYFGHGRIPAERLAWLGRVLLEAIEIDAVRALPQVAALLVHERNRIDGDERHVELDVELLEGVFPAEMQENLAVAVGAAIADGRVAQVLGATRVGQLVRDLGTLLDQERE